jgi:hypothetical protein
LSSNNRLARRTFDLYGLRIKSQWPLPYPEIQGSGKADMEICEGDPAFFIEARRAGNFPPPKAPFLQYGHLADGTIYLCWPGLFEFLISPEARLITGHPLNETSWESFQTYLLGQVLSFALIRRGIEPLHCTVLVRDGQALGILGDSGYGKSTLAAACLSQGFCLLTDDLLVLKETDQGFLAYPSFPRIKLFPEAAQALLGGGAEGTPVNPFTRKLIIPLSRDLSWHIPVLLKAFYVLRPPAPGMQPRRVTIRTLRPRRAFLDLTANTFNSLVTEPKRLKRLFSLAEKLAVRVPFRSLSYPRGLDRLPEVVEAILKDLDRKSR